MDQADSELRETIKKLWPLQAKKQLNRLVPPNEGKGVYHVFIYIIIMLMIPGVSKMNT